MVVEVHWKREQPRPRSKARFSLLGDGLLERTRSTTFGLLGVTAAVGLAAIALALQGDWPLIAGSPVPRAPVLHESVGGATALSGSTPRPAARPAPVGRERFVASHARPTPAPPGPAAVPPAAPPAELVSSPAAPVGGQEGHGDGSDGAPAPPEQTPSPSPSPSTPPSQSQTPAGAPAAQPPTPPQPSPPSPPEAVASEAPPVESGVPPWSNGQGHAYGRDDDREHGCGHDYRGRGGD
jgi:hypothetical protein